MATTVIDSLVVELGMDTRKLKEGEREGLVSLDEFKRRLATVGETAQGGAEKLNNLFAVLRGGIFGLVAALGLGAIASFVEKVMQMDAQTSRLARSLSVSTRELSVWQGVLKQVGGTAENANSLFETLGDTLADIRLGISVPSGPFAFVMSRMGLDIRRSTPEQIMERIPGFVQQERAAGRTDVDIRALLRQIPGMSDPAIFAAMHGDFETMRKAIETIGPLTTKQGEAAEKLVAKQANLETWVDRLASKSMPALNTMVETLTNTFAEAIRKFGGTVPSISFGDSPGRGGGGERLRPAFRSSNNPASIPYGPFAAQLGATGADPRGMAIFPSPEKGLEAAEAFHAMGGDPSVRGFRGSARPIPGPQSSLGGGGTTVNISAINVTSTRADPKQVAAAVPDAINRHLALAGTYNSALT